MMEILANNLNILAIILMFAPLFAAAIGGIFTASLRVGVVNILTCAGMIFSALAASVIYYFVIFQAEVIHLVLLPWFSFSSFAVNWVVYIDSLTASMLLAVTGVSLLVHIYSIGYMSHDEHRQRFMSYLSLFTFCMIMLVCADNFIQLFFGWEGVGLSSYLLIGFWYKKASANNAAIKAFLVNRVGDFGFALGIFLIYMNFQSLNFAEVFARTPEFSDQVITIFGHDIKLITMICLLLFIGCMGKSAQIGLHTWLPDAMEGPTPVSALIHAATMVTAGVFLVARCSPIFEYSQVALNVVAVIGAVTCVFAALIALVQNDIKKIIAYSTCSQLGYMFFACGVSAYAPGIFHLVTHAFFKALLFLGAGSVIHAVLDEQDINKMGGLWRKIPYTYTLFWIGSLALAGIYPFAGYFSKDAILEYAYAADTNFGYFAYIIGNFVAFLTAFYSWRLLIKVFHGKCNVSSKNIAKIHESPFSMMLPLVLLALGAICVGYIGSKMLSVEVFSSEYWHGTLMVLSNRDVSHHVHDIPHVIAYMPLFMGIFGILAAYLVYSIFPIITSATKSIRKPFETILENKFYFDNLYDGLLVALTKAMSLLLWKGLDQRVIDGVPNGLSNLVSRVGMAVNRVQTGYFYHYALVTILTLFAILISLILL